MPITEKTLGTISAMLEARRFARRYLGDRYASEVADMRKILVHLAPKHGGVLEASIAMQKELRDAGKLDALSQATILAATCDEIERVE